MVCPVINACLCVPKYDNKLKQATKTDCIFLVDFDEFYRLRTRYISVVINVAKICFKTNY